MTMHMRRVIAAGVGVLLMCACSGDGESGAEPEDKPTAFDIGGTVSVPSYGGASGTSCTVKDGYEDLRSGATVAVTDAAGDVVGVGALVDIEASPAACRFSFDVADVPEGSPTYGIEVGQAMVKFPRSRLDRAVDLTVG
jgi:hypothetical protein